MPAPSDIRLVRQGRNKSRCWASGRTDRRPFLQDPYDLTDDYWDTCLDTIDSALNCISSILAGYAQS